MAKSEEELAQEKLEAEEKKRLEEEAKKKAEAKQKVTYTPKRENLYVNGVKIGKNFEVTKELEKNAVFMKTFEHALKVKLIEKN
jgi:hypothetical protein